MSKLYDILVPHKEGVRVRRKSWLSRTIFATKSTPFYYDDIMANDWEIVPEVKEKKTITLYLPILKFGDTYQSSTLWRSEKLDKSSDAIHIVGWDTRTVEVDE